MNYTDFLKTKQKNVTESGFEVDNLNKALFEFQKFIVQRALKAGKYAIFADTGLGKTLMQLEWAYRVSEHTHSPVLILAPLAVAAQTIEEGQKFGIEVQRIDEYSKERGLIAITNYEQLDNIDTSLFSGIVLDESSILKNFDGKYRNYLIKAFIDTPYKLACTATPSPNDPMELGNHAQFLDVMSYNEMLAMFFVHDSSDTGQWRLKGHAIERFYEFVSTWSIMLNLPGDIGFDNNGFILPELEINQVTIETEKPTGMLFGGLAVNATDFNRSLRETEPERIAKVVEIVESLGDEQIIIWAKQNQEAANIAKVLSGYNVRNVQGSDSPDKKRMDLIDFAHGKYQVLITKTQIASFGMNFQNCHYQIFASLDFSFESTYQAMRRSWRFGQKKQVSIWMITTDRMINIPKIIHQKEKQFKQMQQQMTSAVNKNIQGKLTTEVGESDDVKTDQYWVMRGDCVARTKEIENEHVDFMVFSPPFADLYTYSNYIEDMGNVANYDEFVVHFGYLVKEIKRILKPGRLCAVHCMDLPTLKGRDGYIGIRRFSSTIADAFEKEGMFLHSEHVIFKDPLLAAVRTKAIGLAHKTVTKDRSMIRTGLPDKMMVFKKPGENKVPIRFDDGRFDHYIPMHEFDKFPKSAEGFNEFWGFDPESKYSKIEQYSHLVWQRYASPVWMDIRQTNVLQYTTARDKNDEKHICPLQLDAISRVVTLWSNPGEVVYSPFGGIGSEGYQSIRLGRKSISIELKKSYFDTNVRNHRNAIEENGQLTLI